MTFECAHAFPQFLRGFTFGSRVPAPGQRQVSGHSGEAKQGPDPAVLGVLLFWVLSTQVVTSVKCLVH